MNPNASAVALLLLAATAASAPSNSPTSPPTMPDKIVEKDWVYQNAGNGTAIAYTNNDSGSTLGVICIAAQNCSVYLKTATACEDGAKYPVLVNADSGAVSASLTCENIASASEKKNFVFVFDDFSTILSTIMKDQSIGVALPLASGQFRVTRFSLTGSNETLAAVNRTIKPAVKAVSNTDQTL